MRRAIDEIARRRTDRQAIFFLTGGTGFLGSHLTAELLKKGHRLILLARPGKGLSARQRVDQLLDGFGLSAQHRQRLEVIQGTLHAPCFELTPDDYLKVSGDVDEIIHCASDTSFTERKRPEIEEVNIGGMRNVLDLAAKGRCYFFHYVSTAYAVGKRTGNCREEVGENDVFTNAYEETKYRAERMASDRCGREGINLSIYRPSVVCGDSETGRAAKFNGFYYPLRTVLFLKGIYAKDIRERGGEKAREMGVKFLENGSLQLPIRVEVAQGGGVNLIPVDHFARAFMALLEGCLEGGIFHIVNPKLTTIEDLVEYTKRLFDVDAIEPCRADAFDRKSKTDLELLFDSFLQAYAPYIRDTRKFEDRKTRAILNPKGIVCPDFNFQLFSRCANYAVACDWGKKILDRNGERKPIP